MGGMANGGGSATLLVGFDVAVTAYWTDVADDMRGSEVEAEASKAVSPDASTFIRGGTQCSRVSADEDGSGESGEKPFSDTA